MALAATLHDPRGALADEVRRAVPRLAALYRDVTVAASPGTSAKVLAPLADAGMLAPASRADLRGPLYRAALRGGLERGAPHVHYLDFDRALHWLRRAPRELAAALRLARRHRVLVLGRTEKAHRSHHVPLYASEALVNRLMARRLGVGGRLDLLVPSFVLARDAAEALVAGSRARDGAIYGEMAALVAGLDGEFAYLECRGLDWETPDRHRRAVRRVGLAEWRRRQETPAEWAFRIAIGREILAGFERALARRGVPAPALCRLPPRAR